MATAIINLDSLPTLVPSALLRLHPQPFSLLTDAQPQSPRQPRA